MSLYNAASFVESRQGGIYYDKTKKGLRWATTSSRVCENGRLCFFQACCLVILTKTKRKTHLIYEVRFLVLFCSNSSTSFQASCNASSKSPKFLSKGIVT